MSKAVFPEKPAVRPLAGTDYVLEEDFYFPAKVEKWDVVVHVKPGFRTDGASIPRWLWPVFGSPYDPGIMAAAIGHDAMYRGRIVPRADADAAFRSMMKANGVARWKRRRIWLGVRLFGWITWLSHTPESVAEARRHIELAFADGGRRTTTNNKPKKGKDKMKKLIITMFENGTLQLLALGVALAALFAAAGCKSIEVERRGQSLATWTDTNGVERVVLDADGKPVILDGGWQVDYFQHWTWQRFDSLEATAGAGVALKLNGYESGADSNLTALVKTSFDGAALLAAKIGAAIATSGGSLAGDAAKSAISEAVRRFVAKGGDAAKATVECADGSCTISDGTVSEVCTDCMK